MRSRNENGGYRSAWFECWNGASWDILFSQLNGAGLNYHKVYEEAMWWKFEPTYYTQGTEQNVQNISSDYTSQGDNWILSCLANDGVENSSWMNSTTVTITQGNYPPNNPTVSINSTDGTNESNQDLNCFATITDPDSSYLNVSVKWYNSSTLKLIKDYNNSYTNNTNFNAILNADNTTKNENWSCSIKLNDGDKNSAWSNSTNLTVKNIVPSISASTIYPLTADLYDDLIGACTASDGDDTQMSFYYKWFNGSNEYTNGSTGTNPYCYQETATLSTACGGLDTGEYFTSGITGAERMYDGDWSTGASTGNGYLYINYSKPSSATNLSLWQVKYQSSASEPVTINNTIYQDCWNQEPLQLRIHLDGEIYPLTYSHVYGHCYNGSTWRQIFFSGVGPTFYEEAMFWDLGALKNVNEEHNISLLDYHNTAVGETWKFSCLAYDGTDNSTWYNSSGTTIQAPANYKPDTPTPIINSTDGTNRTAQNLNCKATITDPDSSILNVTVQWLQSGAVMYEQNYNNSYANNTVFNAMLDSDNTTKNDVWKCRIHTSDGDQSSDWGSSGELTIENTPPSVTGVIKPNSPQNTDDLIGNCTGTDDDTSDKLFYYWQWFKNNTKNESGQSNGWCFQEQSNVVADCGGLSTGTYLEEGDWQLGNETYDANHSTYGAGTDLSGNYIYINYSKPPGVTNASLWEIHNTNGRQNLTINGSCWDQSTLQFRMESTLGTIDSTTFRCYNGTDWHILLDDANASAAYARIYEEGMWWDSKSYNQSVSVNVGNISNSSTTIGEGWIVECVAYDGTDNSSRTNSTGVTIGSGLVYNTPVGTATSWTWGDPQTVGPYVMSGTPDSWTWRVYESGSGRQIPNGTATSWSWINE